MNFFEGIGIFVVALVVFIMLSFLIGGLFTFNNIDEWFYAGAWISGSVVYAITVVIMVYYSRYGGSL